MAVDRPAAPGPVRIHRPVPRPEGRSGGRTRPAGPAGPAGPAWATLRRLVGDWLPGVPFIVLVTLLLAGSAGWLVRASFAGVDGGWTLRAWQDVLGGPLTQRAILNSIRLSAVVAVGCVLIGTPLAWFAAGLSRRSRTVAQGLFTVVANFGGASLAIAMVTTLGSVGFVRLLAADWFGVGVPVDLYGFWGLALTYLYFNLPLYVLLLLPAVTAVRPEWYESVQACAGTRWHFWSRVGGPVLSPFVLAGGVLVFAWSIGQFSVPFALLGEGAGEPLMTLRLGSYLFSATGGSNRFSRAAVLAVLLVVISGVALLLYRALARRTLRRLGAS